MIPQPRLIPCLLLMGRRLVKTVRFDNPTYVGDPVNALRIFNEREVDELVILDISATRHGSAPAFEFIAEIVSEAFMPIAYGGGIRSLEDMRRLFGIGVEKIIVGTQAVEHPDFVAQAAAKFGSQSVVACLDVKKSRSGGWEVYSRGGTNKLRGEPTTLACMLANAGAGELIINSVDRDGTMSGYDISLIRQVSGATTVPVVACGGAGTLDETLEAVNAGASAAAAGSMFVFHGKHRAVLISYPSPDVRARLFRRKE